MQVLCLFPNAAAKLQQSFLVRAQLGRLREHPMKLKACVKVPKVQNIPRQLTLYHPFLKHSCSIFSPLLWAAQRSTHLLFLPLLWDTTPGKTLCFVFSGGRWLCNHPFLSKTVLRKQSCSCIPGCFSLCVRSPRTAATAKLIHCWVSLTTWETGLTYLRQ